MTHRKMTVLMCLTLTLGYAGPAVATTYNVVGVPTVTYTFQSFDALPPGTYDITGSIDVTLSQDLGTTAEFNVNTYVLSLDADHNGTFFEVSDVIVETTPFVHILAVEPSFTAVQFPGPVTLTTDAASGTWNLQGRIGEYDAPGLFGGDTITQSLASGTFAGSFLNPTDLLMTAGYRGEQQLGPFLNAEGGPPLTFAAATADIPAVSEWGLVAMALLMLTAGTVIFMRRQADAAGCAVVTPRGTLT